MKMCQKTLWMGNIEKWMNHQFILSTLNNLNIYPIKISIKNTEKKRGCAFLEFNSRETAENVLKNFNGKKTNGIQFEFNWVKSWKEKYETPKIKKFTVSFL